MLNADGYFDGNTIRTFDRVTAKKNQKVVITFLDEFVDEPVLRKKTARGILNEFAKTDIPNIEDLEKNAWGKAAEKKHETP
ncbi:MAG: hypothetical protein FWD34_02840 [Oscillospiraceae bacterium]|nr:hypothetical protein [Oscillospiraceae bacterium]